LRGLIGGTIRAKLTPQTPASGPQMPINAEYRGPGDLPELIPVFPLPGALLLPRGRCRSTSSSRAIWQWWMMLFATVIV
jgi:hypothetical protein